MANPTDILLDNTTGDLVIVNGDLKIGDSAMQHQQLILLAAKGDFKVRPDMGVNVLNHLHDHTNTLARDTRVEFIKDGMQVTAINSVNGKITIDANY